jgi:hypothetical protein
VRNEFRRSSDIVSKRARRDNGPGQALALNSTLGNSGPGNKIAAVEQNRPQKGKQVVQKIAAMQRQVQKKQDHAKAINKERGRKFTGKETQKKVRKKKQKGSEQKYVALQLRARKTAWKEAGNRP